MYEARHQPPLLRREYILRLLRHLCGALALFAGSILLGMTGYMVFESTSWHESLLNATMMLGGIGPLLIPQSIAGKLFIGLYGIYISLVFVAAGGLILAPVAHRLLHQFHWDEDANG
jgi:hypothetical protein